MKTPKALAVTHELTSAQWGLLTSAQAAQRGVTRLDLGRLAKASLLERVRHGVYRDTGAAHDPFGELRAAWLATDPSEVAEVRLRAPEADVIVCGASAALLHDIGDLREPRFEFASATRRQSSRPDVHFTIRPLEAADITIREGLPTTKTERTIADLVEARTDLSHVADALGDAMRRGSANLQVLARHLAPLAARNGLRRGDGEAFVERLISIAGLDAASTATRIAAIEPLAAPIALTYLRRHAEQMAAVGAQLRTLQTQLDDLPISRALADVRRQTEAMSRAMQPQLQALDDLARQRDAGARTWQSSLSALAPTIDAALAAAAFDKARTP